MFCISTNYDLKWEVSFADEYKISVCKKMINTKRGIVVKKCLNGGSIGYCIRGKFYSLSALMEHIRRVEKVVVPF